MRMSRHLGRVSLLATLTLVASLSSAGHAGATLPSQNGRIAFADFNTGEIYSINPDGSGLRQLTQVPDGTFVAQPAWSPDGRHISFILVSDEIRIYMMDRDGSHQHLVFNDQPSYLDLSPSYTPDGAQLVFTRCPPEGGGSCAIYSVRLDGTHLRALTQFKANDVGDIEPDVSPDGTRIAFARSNAGGITSQIYVMGADGSGPHPITPPALEGFGPEWTPDGRHVLVTSNAVREGAAIYQVNPDGSGLKQLTHPPFPNNDILPSASPQGNRIVFMSDRPYPDLCCQQLYTVRSDGSGLRRLETDLVGITNPDWGPAPPDTTTANPAPIGASATATRPGSAAKLCASHPDLRLLGLCTRHSPLP